MIDQNIINKSTKTAKLSINSCNSTLSPALYTLNNVFDVTLTNKLKNYIDQNQNNWLINHCNLDRTSQHWAADTVIEELHEICNNLTDTIRLKFFDGPLNFLGVNVWKDHQNFSMQYHSDNPIINIAFQIYMFNAPQECGTTFLINDVETAIPYFHNTGYLIITKSQPGLLHKPTSITPKGVVRYSVYAIWSITEKIINKEPTC
jgi:hypothetical protein